MSASVQHLWQSIRDLPRLQRLDRGRLPSRGNAQACLDELLRLMFPGFYETQPLGEAQLRDEIDQRVETLSSTLREQVRFCLQYRREHHLPCEQPEIDCDAESHRVISEFIARLPHVRLLLNSDVEAAFDSDPAATSVDETIFCYPGVLAVTVQRLAHELYLLNVPLLPRIWTEWAHSVTGVDIHPGARMGPRLFIDHGTGVVIGETTHIGSNVKLYQGVTLGALSPAQGQALHGVKRHPTIEDDVVLYAGCTVLGGTTVIGRGSVIGGNVFLTTSVPPDTFVTAEPPRLKYRDRSRPVAAADFQI